MNWPLRWMSCGRTDPEVIELLMERFLHYGLVPFHFRKECVGFIFNRIWAAIKRESLLVVAEGVSEPSDVDRLFTLFTGGKFQEFQTVRVNF
jgi:3-hydroxybutyryl-CoA dehydrogenase